MPDHTLKGAEKIASELKDASRQIWLSDIGLAQAIQGQSGMAEQSYSQALAIAIELGDTRHRCDMFI